MRAILDRFVEALDEEIQFLEKEGAHQDHVLTSGQRDGASSHIGTQYIFLLADATRVPEDSSGVLMVGDRQFPAVVVAQEGNRIWLFLESVDSIPEFIPEAKLILTQTELLVRLRDRVSEMHEFGLAPVVFGLSNGKTEWRQLPPSAAVGSDNTHVQIALEQAFGSDVTFLWGPPGTGKTFSIARLVAALVATGKTVLVTSHTHAAVEQALWATVEPPTEARAGGPLYASEAAEKGQLLKVGPLRQAKIPESCHLDSYLAKRMAEREAELQALMVEQEELRGTLRQVERELRLWDQVATLTKGLQETTANLSDVREDSTRAVHEQKAAQLNIEAARNALTKAKTSFVLGRKGRVGSAQRTMSQAVETNRAAEQSIAQTEIRVVQLEQRVTEQEDVLKELAESTSHLTDADALRRNQSRVVSRMAEIGDREAHLSREDDALANELLDNARGLFLTLSKLYMDPRLRDREWDAVIIDEASMAMPPLVAFAAARAQRQVIIVGDFFQLSPIVHSDEEVVTSELGKDVFEKRGIPAAVDEGGKPEQLARLSIQRRMAPGIADVARKLVYGDGLQDHPDTATRSLPEWVASQFGEEPLVVVDISGYNPWCGKERGTLSRFNLYSGLAAVELAALYASHIPEPAVRDQPPIGVVTPYAAQRRYLVRLVGSLGLERWVVAGTVHTFQGNESDVIIFDSVLAEPSWTARLTNPHEFKSVRRDLNVAVTRARHQFVFVGAGDWLDKNAKAGSGYGELWNHLGESALRVDGLETLGARIREGLTDSSRAESAWISDVPSDSATLLDETQFYSHFERDLANARERVLLFTPFVGKRRWPKIEPHVTSVANRGVEVFLFHRPLDDASWREGDPQFGRRVFEGLSAAGVHLIPISGVHAKTISIDDEIVYEGSLNWASHTASYEHMWRIEDPGFARLINRMLQLREITRPFSEGFADATTCPNCGGQLRLLNQRDKGANWSKQAMAFVCENYSRDKKSCRGYLRGVDKRPPIRSLQVCDRGTTMHLYRTKNGRPWEWRCSHRSCSWTRWNKGDIEPE